MSKDLTKSEDIMDLDLVVLDYITTTKKQYSDVETKIEDKNEVTKSIYIPKFNNLSSTQSNILKQIKTSQSNDGNQLTILSSKKPNPTAVIGRVVLTEDFISEKSADIIQSYTTPIVNQIKLNDRSKRSKNTKSDHQIGHCLPAQLCQACAEKTVSVISELTLEFDGLLRLLTDHCVEINSFFKLNPKMGAKLLRKINDIDKCLSCYYERTKTKYNGLQNSLKLPYNNLSPYKNITDVLDSIARLQTTLQKAMLLKIYLDDRIEKKSNELKDLTELCELSTKTNKTRTEKREVKPNINIKIETPLNTDSSGNFWNNYLNKDTSNNLKYGTNEDTFNILEQVNDPKINKMTNEELGHLIEALVVVSSHEDEEKGNSAVKSTISNDYAGSYLENNKSSNQTKTPKNIERSLHVHLTTNHNIVSANSSKNNIIQKIPNTTNKPRALKKWARYFFSTTKKNRLVKKSSSSMVPFALPNTEDVENHNDEEYIDLKDDDLEYMAPMTGVNQEFKHVRDVKENITDLLYSILNYEANKLNEELKQFSGSTINSRGKILTKTTNSLEDQIKEISTSTNIKGPESLVTHSEEFKKTLELLEKIKINITESVNEEPKGLFKRIISRLSPKIDFKKALDIRTPNKQLDIEDLSNLNVNAIDISSSMPLVIYIHATTEKPIFGTDNAIAFQIPTIENTISTTREAYNISETLKLSERAIETLRPGFTLYSIAKITNTCTTEPTSLSTKTMETVAVKDTLISNSTTENLRLFSPLSTLLRNVFVTNFDFSLVTKRTTEKVKTTSTRNIVNNKSKSLAANKLNEVNNNDTTETKPSIIDKNKEKTTLKNNVANAETKPIDTRKTTKINQENNVIFSTKKEAKHVRGQTEANHLFCDVATTYNLVLKNYYTLSSENFKQYIKNLTCYKYRLLPKYFFVEYEINNLKGIRWKRKKLSSLKRLNWNWIRQKRSLLSLDTENEYDTFSKDENGIYRIKKKMRRKRELDLKQLSKSLMDLPKLNVDENHIYAFVGDTVIIQCDQDLSQDAISDCVWFSRPENLLQHDNVINDGQKLTVNNVQTKNIGVYNIVGMKLNRSLKLHVVQLPTFNILSVAAYDLDTGCHYDDLKVFLKHLPAEISKHVCSNANCHVRIEEPVCLKDNNGKAAVQMSLVVTLTMEPISCGAECDRNLQCSIVMLHATNVPALLSVPVIVFDGFINKTFSSSRHHNRDRIVTHTLRQREPSQDVEYRELAATMSPGDLRVVLTCPPGYYLMKDHKICGVGLSPRSLRPRESLSDEDYQRQIYNNTSIMLAIFGVLSVCAVGALCSIGGVAGTKMREIHRRDTEPTEPRAILPPPRRRPLSPSRVILARILHGSSSRAATVSDSQDKKLEQCVEEVQSPPPLPPIDFEF